MTELEAQDWIRDHFGASGVASMVALIRLVEGETAVQNLVAPSTLSVMWNRHILDSAQLISLVPDGSGPWIDIGSGAGFPGLVVAALTSQPVTLIEPRKRRAEFLERAAEDLGLSDRLEVICGKAEAVQLSAAVISARAVAPLSQLFAWGENCATPATHWVLPKGRSAREEVTSARHAWHGVFHVEHSLSDPESLIVLASGVTRR